MLLKVAFSTPYIASLYYHPKREDFAPFTRRKGDAGIDLRAPYDVHFVKDQVYEIPFGVHLEMPEGYFGLLCLRSSMGQNGYSIDNSPGIIDNSYRGQLRAFIRFNGIDLGNDSEKGRIMAADRICQLILLPYINDSLSIERIEMAEMTETERGVNGFGSTGKQ